MTSFTGVSLVNKSNEKVVNVQQNEIGKSESKSSWWDSNWTHRKQIIIDHTKVAGNLINFPVLVKTVLDTSKVQDDADDIVFTSNDGYKLNHEIEFYNSVSGELIVWVNITSLSSTIDTIFWMYYGNPLCENQQNKEGTWDLHYNGVWHLKESTGIRYDSTSNGNDCGASGTTHTTSAKIDGGEIYDANSDGIYTNSNINSMSTFTLECWVAFNSVVGGTGDDIMQILPNNPTIFRYTDNRLHVWVDGGYEIIVSNHFFNDTDWHYVVLLATGAVLQLFVDSNLEGFNTWSSSTGSYHFCLGDNWMGTDTFQGIIDESRISNNPRSVSWIYTSYNTVNLSSTFLIFGVEQSISIPYANFTYAPENPTNTTIIHFTDTSTVINGTIISWWWDFGDYTYSDVQNPNHCYYIDGDYNVTLTVTDNNGATNSTQKTIVVYTPPDHSPNIPANPFPSNGATDVSINTDLSWSGGDPDGDPVTYDVYFGTTSSPPKIIANQSATSCHPGTLGFNTTYYWRIVAWDDDINHANGPIWYFTTQQNLAPNAPIINGPTSGETGSTYSYTFVAIDPENDDISYEIDWGDGTVDDWYGPVESNVIITRSHQWTESGTYTIQARAKDIHDAIGAWGTLSVTMPLDLRSQQSTQIILLRLIKNNVMK